MSKIVHKKAAYDVYITDDYSMFKKLPGNRDVKRIKKIIACIKTLGFVGGPIVVNEKMEIIDGQHRFEALKILGLPVEYIIRPGLTIKECVALNINSKNWGMLDYLESHAKQGDATYQWVVDEIIAKYTDFLVDDIVAIVNSKGATCNNGSYTRAKVRDGQLSLTQDEMDQVIETMNWLQPYMQYIKKIAGGKTYPLINAIMWCEAHQKSSCIDMNRFFTKIFEKNWSSVMRRNCVSEYLVQFDSIYNKGFSKNSKNLIYTAGDYANACRNAGLNVTTVDGQTVLEQMDEEN